MVSSWRFTGRRSGGLSCRVPTYLLLGSLVLSAGCLDQSWSDYDALSPGSGESGSTTEATTSSDSGWARPPSRGSPRPCGPRRTLGPSSPKRDYSSDLRSKPTGLIFTSSLCVMTACRLLPRWPSAPGPSSIAVRVASLHQQRERAPPSDAPRTEKRHHRDDSHTILRFVDSILEADALAFALARRGVRDGRPHGASIRCRTSAGYERFRGHRGP